MDIARSRSKFNLDELDIFAIEPLELFKTFAKRLYENRCYWTAWYENCDPSHRSVFVLCARHERTCGHGSDDNCDKLSAPKTHWITSSARAISEGGRLRPSAFAVFRLITSSILVGCTTGGSEGFAPLSTWLA